MSRSRHYVPRWNDLDRAHFDAYRRRRDDVRTGGDRHRVEVAGAGVPLPPRGERTIADCPVNLWAMGRIRNHMVHHGVPANLADDSVKHALGI